jgi:hypothetical protein
LGDYCLAPPQAGLRFGSGEAEFPPNPLPPRPRGADSFFRRNLRLYFAKQNAPPKEMLPLTHPTHSRATLRNSLKFYCSIFENLVS